MISAAQASVPRRLYPFAHLVGFHIRAGLPIAVGAACVLLAIQLFLRLHPRMKLLSASDRGLLMSILLLIVSAVIALLVAERDNPHLLLTLPISPRKAVLAEIVATWSLSLLLTGVGLLGFDLYALILLGDPDLPFGPLWLIPTLGLVLGEGMAVAISKGAALFARGLLLRLGTIVGWILLDLGAAWAAAWPCEEIIVPLFLLSFLLLLAASLSKSDLLLMRQFSLLKSHLWACCLLFVLPLMYVANLYGPRFTGPDSVERSLLFPRLQFGYLLNPETGEPERYGWRAPYPESTVSALLRNGWIFTTFSGLSSSSVRSLSQSAQKRTLFPAEGWGATTVNGKPFWVRVQPRREILGATLLLKSVIHREPAMEIDFPGRADVQPWWYEGIVLWPSAGDAEILALRDSHGSTLFSLRESGGRLAALSLGSGFLDDDCSRFTAIDPESSDQSSERIFDLKSGAVVPFNPEGISLSVSCNSEVLAVFQEYSSSGTYRRATIDLFPLHPDPDLEERRRVEIPSVRSYLGPLFWTSDRSLYSMLSPERPIVRLQESLGEILFLERINERYVFAALRAGRYAVIDLVSRKIWGLEQPKLEGEPEFLLPDPGDLYLAPEKGKLVLLDLTGVWKASLAEGTWQVTPLEDLPITWIN